MKHYFAYAVLYLKQLFICSKYKTVKIIFKSVFSTTINLMYRCFLHHIYRKASSFYGSIKRFTYTCLSVYFIVILDYILYFSHNSICLKI